MGDERSTPKMQDRSSTIGAQYGGMAPTVSFRNKPSDLTWVPACKGEGSWRAFRKDFQVPASFFLKPKYFESDDEWKEAYLVALLKAAELGGFRRMKDDLHDLHSKDIGGKELLDELKKMYLPLVVVRRHELELQFDNFDFKKGESLLVGLRRFDRLVDECKEVGKVCEEDRKATRVFRLIPPGKKTDALLACSSSSSTAPVELSYDKIRKYADMLAAVDCLTKRAGGGAREEFANAAQGQARRHGFPPGASQGQDNGKDKKGDDKKSFKPTGAGQADCTVCGQRHSGGAAACRHKDKTCNSCGKRGHLVRVCPSAKDVKQARGAIRQQDLSGF